MANPIKASDLLQDDGAIKKILQQLEAVRDVYKELLADTKKEAIQLRAEIERLNVTNADHREEIKRIATQSSKLQKANQAYQNSLADQNKKIQELRLATQQMNNLRKLEAKAALAAEGSYNKLSAQYSLMKVQLNQMGEESEAARNEKRKLEKQAKQLYERMKELQEATGKTALNVGNYKESVKQAIAESGNFNKVLTLLTTNPIVGIIAAIAAGLYGLFKAFQRSEQGAQLLAKATGALNGLMSVAVKVADKVASVIISAFQDPQQAVKDLWQAIKTNIVNRFEGLIDLFGNVGTALKALWQRDFVKLKESVKEAGNSLIQFGVGVDPDKVKEFAAGIVDMTQAFADLAVKQREVAKLNRELSRSLESVITEQELQNQIADDSTRSFQEQKDAIDAALAASERRAALELQIAQNNLSLLNQELALRRRNGEDVNALADEQLTAFQALSQAQRDYSLTLAENATKRREILRDEFEKELDYAIDVFDAQKTVNERRIADEELSAQKRANILVDTVNLTERSFADQIALVEEYTGKKLELDDLVNESDQRVIRDRLRAQQLDEITLTRIMEIIRERKFVLQDLYEAQRDFNAELRKQREEDAIIAGLPTINNLKKVKTGVEEIFDTIKDRRKQQIEDAKKQKPEDIFELLGFKLTNDEKQGVISTFQFVKQQFIEFLNVRKQIADQAVQAADREVQATEAALQREIESRNAGFANRVETAQKEFDLAKANQEKALEEQRKAQQQQEKLQTIQQAGNLITAAAKIWGQLGFPFAIPAIALMFGSFAAAKIKAAKLSKKIFRKGGYEVLQGGSHESGNDIPLGINSKGQERRAEGGEGMAIFSKSATKKYGDLLPQLVQAINKGRLEERFTRLTAPASDLPLLINNRFDTSRIEYELSAIRKQGEREGAQYFRDANGNMVEVYRNRKRVYVN